MLAPDAAREWRSRCRLVMATKAPRPRRPMRRDRLMLSKTRRLMSVNEREAAHFHSRRRAADHAGASTEPDQPWLHRAERGRRRVRARDVWRLLARSCHHGSVDAQLNGIELCRRVRKLSPVPIRRALGQRRREDQSRSARRGRRRLRHKAVWHGRAACADSRGAAAHWRTPNEDARADRLAGRRLSCRSGSSQRLRLETDKYI